MDYQCRLIFEDGAYTVEFPDVPSVITYGETEEQALANAAEALNGALAADVGRGMLLPTPTVQPGEGLHPITVDANIVVADLLRRTRGDLSQQKLAARRHVPYQVYQKLENPGKGNPTIKTLEKIAAAMGKRLVVSIE